MNKKIKESERPHFLWLAKNTENLLKAMSSIGSSWCDDEEFVIECLKKEPMALMYASERLRNKKEIVYPLIKKESAVHEYVGDSLKKEKDFLLLMIENDKYENFLIKVKEKEGQSWGEDPQIVKSLVKRNPFYFHWCSKELRQNEDFLLNLVKCSKKSFEYFDRQKRSEKSFVIKALRLGAEYASISDKLKKDEDVLYEGMKMNPKCFAYAHEDLRATRLIAIWALEFDGNSYRYLSEELRSDKDLLFLAIESCRLKEQVIDFSEKIPESLKSKEIALLCIKSNSSAFKNFNNYTENKEVVMAAVKSEGDVLFGVNEEFQEDPKIILEAIKEDGTALLCTSAKYRENVFYCYKAMQSFPWIYNHLSSKMKDEAFLAHLAIKNDGSLIKYSSERIRDDLRLMNMAVFNGIDCLMERVGPKIRKCIEFGMARLERSEVFSEDSISQNAFEWFVKNIKSEECQEFLKSIDYEDLGSTLNYSQKEEKRVNKVSSLAGM